MAEREDHDEILRLRKRLHGVESKIVGLEIHAHNALAWQARYEPIIEDLREADRIAEGVAKRLNEQQTALLTKGEFRLTRRQTWAAIAGVLIAGAALLVDALAQTHVI